MERCGAAFGKGWSVKSSLGERLVFFVILRILTAAVLIRSFQGW